MKQPPREIEVHIEELVLYGFPSGARHGVAAALENELGALLASGGIPTGWHSSPERIEVGTKGSIAHLRPTMAGEHIARAIHEGSAP